VTTTEGFSSRVSSHDPHTTMKTEQEPSHARIRGPVSSHDFRPQIRALTVVFHDGTGRYRVGFPRVDHLDARLEN